VDLVTTGTLRPTIMSAPTAAVGAQTDMARTWRIDVIDPKRTSQCWIKARPAHPPIIPFYLMWLDLHTELCHYEMIAMRLSLKLANLPIIDDPATWNTLGLLGCGDET